MVVGQERHYQGWHGWTYEIVRPDEYMKHCFEREQRLIEAAIERKRRELEQAARS
jgi:hypothetical protein